MKTRAGGSRVTLMAYGGREVKTMPTGPVKQLKVRPRLKVRANRG